MNEMKKMQMLHQRAVLSGSLTAKEQNELQNWYETLDRDEDSFLNKSQPIQNVEELRYNLTEITEQTSKFSREVKNLISQNEKIRQENQTLKNL